MSICTSLAVEKLEGIFLTANSTPWQGQLDLRFQVAGDKTILSRSYGVAPLKVQRPFYPEPAICHTVILHSAGGMVGGDRLSSRIDLAPGSQALMTTAAAAKIYRSTGAVAQQQIAIELGANAYLEWLPQDTIIFNQAQYQQNLRVNLAAGAVFCGWEIVRLGRSARQETFTAGSWQNALEVWQGGRPLWIDRQRLTGDQWQSGQATAGQPILGLLVWLGGTVNSSIVDQVRALGPTQELDWGATALAGGLVCRYRGSDRQAVQAWFVAVWDLLRRQYRQRPACPPRVWQR
jgi:urease accessory protein